MAPSALSSAYLDSAPLHLDRGFRHICFTATSASGNAYLDSAPLHRGRAFATYAQAVRMSNAYLDSARSSRSWLSPHAKKEERSSGMQAFLSPFLFFPRCSMLNVKNRRPRSFYVCKNSDFKCAIRGSNPGHPD